MKTLDYEHLTPPQHCPVCAYPIDRSAGDAERPQPDDITVCLSCGAALVFGAGLLLTPANLDSLDPETVQQIIHMQGLIAELRKAV